MERSGTPGSEPRRIPARGSGRQLVAAAIDPLPLNVMLIPGLPSITVLGTLGVRRVSAGAAIAQAALGITSRLATDFLTGSADEMFAMAADYGATNGLFPGD